MGEPKRRGGPFEIRSLRLTLATLVASLALIPVGAHAASTSRIDQERFSPRTKSTASWFDDRGSTACGIHVLYGYAHLPGAGWPCGARVLFCYRYRCVVGFREDSGPYIAGRIFDLNPHLKSALGCSDLCPITWRRLR